MRTILLLLDGLGDRGHPLYAGKTPLAAASTPNLDKIAEASATGLYHSYIPGIPMSSEIAHFLMFGYDLSEFPGRGAIEAAGYGISLSTGDVAMLARIFSTRPKGGLLFLEVEDPDLELSACRELQEQIRSFEIGGFRLEFTPTEGVEGILVIRGSASEKITDSNPIYEGRPLMEVRPLNNIGEARRAAEKTAQALNSYLVWCHHTLARHPVNVDRARKGLCPVNALGTQRAGRRREVQPFMEKWGMKSLSISSGAVYHGLCQMVGMEIIRAKESGDAERDLRERLKQALEAASFDFIHVHTKAADTASHTKNPETKKAVIEALDSALSLAVREIIPDDDILFVVTSDHSTPSTGQMIHSGEPVPVMIRGKLARVDDVGSFNEASCARGGLGLIRGPELMYHILDLTDRGKLWGLMDSPANQPYSPGIFRPLKID
ncbi:MAG: 2,3-bisphosphoglycerate-independent phosphoglycerate mutase [Deltaproteobacteria bacterium]|nr:2,3-bisphosphoglycerate-independent phosphoglycerate mutase [Deltaproteobacteria bacterium]NIS77143.1 2,3-bisphosphoglycerate-independent phosphoglycerate mutase [Deltaproteobacteria bacterium]